MNFLERLIATISPGWALRRKQYRAQLLALESRVADKPPSVRRRDSDTSGWSRVERKEK